MSSRRAVLSLSLVVALAPFAHAQSVPSIAVAAGRTTDARGVRSNSMTVAPSLMVVLGALSALSLGGAATQFESGTWSAGPTAALSARTRGAGPLAFSLNGSGGVAWTSYQVRFVSGDVVPAAELEWRGLTVYGGAHATSGMTTAQSATGGGPFGIGPTERTITRSSVAPVYGARVRAGRMSGTSALLWVRDDPMHIDGVRVHDRTAGAAVSSGRLTLSGSAGSRRASDERVDFANGGVSLLIARGASLDIGAGSYPSNRLTGASAGRYVTAGISMRFGGGAAALPSPSGVERVANGATRLSIRAPQADRVELAGDWNDWQPMSATRASNGVWYADVVLQPGEYRYSFRIDGHEWRAPSGTIGVDDGFGGRSAYIVVRGAGAVK